MSGETAQQWLMGYVFFSSLRDRARTVRALDRVGHAFVRSLGRDISTEREIETMREIFIRIIAHAENLGWVRTLEEEEEEPNGLIPEFGNETIH